MAASDGAGRPLRRCAWAMLFAVASTAVGASAAHASPHAAPSVRIGEISSEQTCERYQESAGRAGALASPGALAVWASWRTWLVRDCIDHFASLRASLEAALAASGTVTISPRAPYLVTARISEASGGGDAPPEASSADGGFAIATQDMFVNVDISLRDATGRTVYGSLFTKRLRTGSDVRTPGFHAASGQTGQALYGELQHEVALTAARAIAFHLVPLAVTGGDGHATIRFNYGAPLLTLGTNLQVTNRDGSVARYRVIAAADGSSTAELDGDGDARRVTLGSRAVVLEPDDPAANGRRMRRVNLP